MSVHNEGPPYKARASPSFVSLANDQFLCHCINSKIDYLKYISLMTHIILEISSII